MEFPSRAGPWRVRLRAPGRRAAGAALPLGLLALALLAGCSNATLKAGAALASAGQTAATAMQQAALVTPADVQQLETSDTFLNAYYGGVATPQIAQRHALIAAIRKELAARAAVLSSLANAYAALGKLASENASGNINTALAGLTASVGSYAAQAGLPPLPNPVGNLLPAAGGLIVGAVQAQEVRADSNRILAQLEHVITAMQTYKNKFVGFKYVLVSQGGDAAHVLYASGLYSAVPLLNLLGAPYGYTAVAQADARLASPKLKAVRAGLDAVQSARLQAQADLIDTSYTQSLIALQKLKAQHEAFDKGAPIDLSQLLTDVAQIQMTTNQLLAALQPTPASGK